jgi:hypothetical protein
VDDDNTALRRDGSETGHVMFVSDCACSLNKSVTCYNTIIPKSIVITVLLARLWIKSDSRAYPLQLRGNQ